MRRRERQRASRSRARAALGYVAQMDPEHADSGFHRSIVLKAGSPRRTFCGTRAAPRSRSAVPVSIPADARPEPGRAPGLRSRRRASARTPPAGRSGTGIPTRSRTATSCPTSPGQRPLGPARPRPAGRRAPTRRRAGLRAGDGGAARRRRRADGLESTRRTCRSRSPHRPRRAAIGCPSRSMTRTAWPTTPPPRRCSSRSSSGSPAHTTPAIVAPASARPGARRGTHAVALGDQPRPRGLGPRRRVPGTNDVDSRKPVGARPATHARIVGTWVPLGGSTTRPARCRRGRVGHPDGAAGGVRAARRRPRPSLVMFAPTHGRRLPAGPRHRDAGGRLAGGTGRRADGRPGPCRAKPVPSRHRRRRPQPRGPRRAVAARRSRDAPAAGASVRRARRRSARRTDRASIVRPTPGPPFVPMRREMPEANAVAGLPPVGQRPAFRESVSRPARRCGSGSSTHAGSASVTPTPACAAG